MKKIYNIIICLALIMSFSNCKNEDSPSKSIPSFGQIHDNSFYYNGIETRSYSNLDIYPTSINKSEINYDDNAYHFTIEDNSGNYKMKVLMSSRNIDRIIDLTNIYNDTTTLNSFLSIMLEEGYGDSGSNIFSFDLNNKNIKSYIKGNTLETNENCFIEGKIGTAMLDTCIIIEMSGKLRNNDVVAIKAKIDKKNFNANLLDPLFGLISDNQMIANDEIINIYEVTTDTSKVSIGNNRFNVTYDYKLKAKNKTNIQELELIINDTLLNKTIDLGNIENFNYGHYNLTYKETNAQGKTTYSFGINNDSIYYNERLNFGYIKDSLTTSKNTNIFKQGCMKLSVTPSGCNLLFSATLTNNKKYVINGLDKKF